MNQPLKLYVDMDGTLFRFHDTAHEYIERMWEPGFYRDLQPFESMVEGLRTFISRNPDVQVYILSAVLPTEPPFVEEEKRESLRRYLPEIPDDHILFVPAGADKAAYIGEITDRCYLIDDYNKNLREWRAAGGNSIKFINDVNNKGLGAYGGEKGQLWTGSTLHYESNSLRTCFDIEGITELVPFSEQTMYGFEGDVSPTELFKHLYPYLYQRQTADSKQRQILEYQGAAPVNYEDAAAYAENYPTRFAGVEEFCKTNGISKAEQSCLEACYIAGTIYGISNKNMNMNFFTSLCAREWDTVLPTPSAMRQFVRKTAARDRELHSLYYAVGRANAELNAVKEACVRPCPSDVWKEIVTHGEYSDGLCAHSMDLSTEHRAMLNQWEELAGAKYPNIRYGREEIAFDKYDRSTAKEAAVPVCR